MTNTVLHASDKGNRISNMDGTAIKSWKNDSLFACAMVVCDGVGSRIESDLLASHCCRYITTMSKELFFAPNPKNLFQLEQKLSVLEHQLNLSIFNCKFADTAASTLAALIMIGKTTICLWAGDSRVYCIDEFGKFVQLTRDHTDTEGRITRFISPTQSSSSAFEFIININQRSPVAICLTTDGVHSACDDDELHLFVEYCVRKKISTNEQLKSELSKFLGPNIDDNFSMCLFFGVSRFNYMKKKLAV